MKYIEVEFEIIEFDTEDIIITSGCDFNGECEFYGTNEGCPTDIVCTTNSCSSDCGFD